MAFTCACAQKVAPAGGPKDTTPAGVTRVVPASGSTNVTGKTVTISFDDYVDRSVRNSVTVLPSRRNRVTYSGDEIDIEFDEPLEPNTTYSVSLGTEWTDLRGNTPLSAFTMVFSTGNTIDSGSITGKVFGKQVGGLSVFCYGRADTCSSEFSLGLSVPPFKLPIGSSGSFSVLGLRDGLYRVAVVRDENRNGLLDNNEDFVVAHKDVLVTNGTSAPLMLMIGGPLDNDPPQPIRARAVTAHRVQITLTEPSLIKPGFSSPVSMSVGADESVAIAAAWIPRGIGDTIEIRTATPLDTSQYTLRFVKGALVDTSGNVLLDTAVQLGFNGVVRTDTSALRISSISPLDSSRGIASDSGIKVTFREAVDTNIARLTIWHESPTGAVPVSVQWRDPTTLMVYPTKPRATRTWYSTKITPTDVRSFDGRRYPDTTITHSIYTEERRPEPGSIDGTFEVASTTLDPTPLLLRLFNQSGALARTVVVLPGKPLHIDSLPGGDYRVDVFHDRNGNGVYDHGARAPFLHGEQWWSVEKPISVRARWVTEGVMITRLDVVSD